MMPADVMIRRIPYPYKAMLAICSDLDETPDADSYFGLMRFLNTAEDTSCGRGVNLEIGNSIYFDMPKNQFSYWNTNDGGREKIHALIRSGHIDCLHSFGDYANTRQHAERALNELQKHECSMKVWVDHAVAPTNFGADIMHGFGDVEGHQAFHADLTAAFGIEYVWTGRVTSVIGQDRPFTLSGIANRRYLKSSLDTLFREYAKHVMGRYGSVKYRMHGVNRILQPVKLRNAMVMHEFIRCNPHWGGISSSDRGDKIHDVLTRSFLEKLVGREGVSVLYTHLGKIGNCAKGCFLPESGINAFRLLASYYHEKKILVTTTRKLLDYIKIRDTIILEVEPEDHRMNITRKNLEPGPDKKQLEFSLAGISFETTEQINEVHVNGIKLGPDSFAVEQQSNRWRISFPWKKLKYPEL